MYPANSMRVSKSAQAAESSTDTSPFFTRRLQILQNDCQTPEQFADEHPTSPLDPARGVICALLMVLPFWMAVAAVLLAWRLL